MGTPLNDSVTASPDGCCRFDVDSPFTKALGVCCFILFDSDAIGGRCSITGEPSLMERSETEASTPSTFRSRCECASWCALLVDPAEDDESISCTSACCRNMINTQSEYSTAKDVAGRLHHQLQRIMLLSYALRHRSRVEGEVGVIVESSSVLSFIITATNFRWG
jgi:hypothetical protein